MSSGSSIRCAKARGKASSHRANSAGASFVVVVQIHKARHGLNGLNWDEGTSLAS